VRKTDWSCEENALRHPILLHPKPTGVWRVLAATVTQQRLQSGRRINVSGPVGLI
jgi:hypothetical protein